MEQSSPSAARKRLRLSQGDPLNRPNALHSPKQNDAAVGPPVDVVAEFAARAGRVQSLQQDLQAVKHQAQQQAEALTLVTSELSSLRVSSSLRRSWVDPINRIAIGESYPGSCDPCLQRSQLSPDHVAQSDCQLCRAKTVGYLH